MNHKHQDQYDKWNLAALIFPGEKLDQKGHGSWLSHSLAALQSLLK